jgi:tetratricopeptide (TPR) repeat protein
MYYKQARLAEAETWYRKALEAKPDYTNALNNLGGVELQLEEWDKAIDTLTKSITLYPDFANSYYNLGWAYENKGNLGEAEHMYAKAVELSPLDPDALSSLARLLYARKQTDEAASLLRRALAIDASNSIAIGVVMQMKKDGVAE